MNASDEIAKWLRTQIRVGKIGPNSAAIIERGGTVCLTPQEAEDAADALLASPAFADLIDQARAEALATAADELDRIHRIGKTTYDDSSPSDLDTYLQHPLGDALSRIGGPESWDVRPIAATWLRDRAATY